MSVLHYFPNAGSLVACLEGALAAWSADEPSAAGATASGGHVNTWLATAAVYHPADAPGYYLRLADPPWRPDPAVDRLLRWAAPVDDTALGDSAPLPDGWRDVVRAMQPRPWRVERDFTHLLVVLDGTRQDFITIRDQLLTLEQYNPGFQLRVAPLDTLRRGQAEGYPLRPRPPEQADGLSQAFPCLLQLDQLHHYGPVRDWQRRPEVQVFYRYGPPPYAPRPSVETGLYIEWGYELPYWPFIAEHFPRSAEYVLLGGAAAPAGEAVADGGQPRPAAQPRVYSASDLTFVSLFQVCDVDVGTTEAARLVERDVQVEERRAFRTRLQLVPRLETDEQAEVEALRQHIALLSRTLRRLEFKLQAPTRPVEVYAYREPATPSAKGELDRLRAFLLEQPQAEIRRYRYASIRTPQGERLHLVMPADFGSAAGALQAYRPALVFYRDPVWANVGFNLFLPAHHELSPRILPDPEVTRSDEQARLRAALGLSTSEQGGAGDVILLYHPLSSEAPAPPVQRLLVPAHYFMGLDQEPAIALLNEPRVGGFKAEPQEVSQRLTDRLAVEGWQGSLDTLAAQAANTIATAWPRLQADIGTVLSQAATAREQVRRIEAARQDLNRLTTQRLAQWQAVVTQVQARLTQRPPETR